MQETRQCKTCEKILSISDFKITHRKVSPTHPAGLYYTRDCKPCLNKKRRENRANNKERERLYRIRDFCKKFGYSKEVTEALQRYYLLHNGKCDICNIKVDSNMHVDHCHTTMAIRGLICHNCNLLLGHAKDNKDILLSAINYLEYENAFITKDLITVIDHPMQSWKELDYKLPKSR